MTIELREAVRINRTDDRYAVVLVRYASIVTAIFHCRISLCFNFYTAKLHFKIYMYR